LLPTIDQLAFAHQHGLRLRACAVDAKERPGGIAPPDVVRNIVEPVRAAELVRGIVRRPVPAGVTILALGL
jgi:hypothetical protein